MNPQDIDKIANAVVGSLVGTGPGLLGCGDWSGMSLYDVQVFACTGQFDCRGFSCLQVFDCVNVYVVRDGFWPDACEESDGRCPADFTCTGAYGVNFGYGGCKVSAYVCPCPYGEFP